MRSSMIWRLLLLGVLPGGGRADTSGSLLATVGCDGRTGKKELLDMSVALLHAHRYNSTAPVQCPLFSQRLPSSYSEKCAENRYP
jgi:hypothetical protein